MKRYFAIIFAVALLLSGCAVSSGTTGMQLATWPTVEDIFTLPTTTAPVTPTAPTVPGGTQATEPTKPAQSIEPGGLGFGPDGENWEKDEMGRIYRYEGGQMCLPFMLQASGQALIDCVEKGIGILLFLDGQPQPYRIEENGELAYFHVLHPDYNTQKPITQEVHFDIYFTPVTGQEGDVLELWSTTIQCPNWQTSDPQTAWKYTFGGIQAGTRVKLYAKPEEEMLKIMERVSCVDISYVDTTSKEVGGWSDQELTRRYDYTWFVDGRRPKLGDGYIYDFQASDSVELRFEIWGTPYVRYGLMFYIDNQPISSRHEILFDMQSGKKTIVTVTLDLSDFDGECVVYAALIPRNAKTPENFNTIAFLNMSKTFFLLDDQEPEK